MYADRSELAAAIADKLVRQEPELHRFWTSSAPVRHFVVDDLLDPAWVATLAERFPSPDLMLLRSSIRERKRAGVAVDKYDALVQDALFAFQDPRVVEVVGRITGHRVVADPTLYASGVSVMSSGDFLNPHIDNSHDGDRRNYRVLNLLFYVTPEWCLSNGGNLELWDTRIRTPSVIESKFNRLVIMETNQTSWHSVNRVRVDGTRRCVSNYYFSETPAGGRPYFNVTTFTGRPEEPLKRMVLGVMDGVVLNVLGRTFPSLTKRSKHRIRPTR
jgi:Rps23 Pro-64 3,4-dihydroxylase Tpa1-like proline 4-hydroxylase